MDDPFFRAQKSPAGWGRHNSYLEDISRTYKTALGPQLGNRESETYKRALAFREREKAHYARLEGDYKTLRSQHYTLERDFDELSSQLSKIMETYKKNAVPTRSDSGRVDAPAPDKPDEEPKADEHSGSGLPDAALPDDGADPHRSPRKHDAERRQTGGHDSAGSVEQPEEPVPEGGS